MNLNGLVSYLLVGFFHSSFTFGCILMCYLRHHLSLRTAFMEYLHPANEATNAPELKQTAINGTDGCLLNI